MIVMMIIIITNVDKGNDATTTTATTTTIIIITQYTSTALSPRPQQEVHVWLMTPHGLYGGCDQSPGGVTPVVPPL